MVGKTITVFTNSPSTKEYGHYKIDSIDLSQDVGVVELSHVPDTQSNASGLAPRSVEIDRVSGGLFQATSSIASIEST